MKLLLYTVFIPVSLMGMLPDPQDGGDLVKKGLYSLFGVPRHYDSMQAYDQNVNRYSTDEEIKRSYKKRALTLHPDKNKCKTKEESEKITEDFKKFEAVFGVFKSNATSGAGETYGPKNISKDEYDTYLHFIDIYSLAIKAAAAGITMYSCWLAYQWTKNNFGSSPKASLNQLHAVTHKVIDRLLTVKFDRYVNTEKDFSLVNQVDIQPLCIKLSEPLSEKLREAMIQADKIISRSYAAIAWKYYDCQSIDEMKARAPQIVQDLLSCQTQLEEIIDECKKELGIESFYVSCKRLVKPMLGLAGLISLSALWIRHKQSQVKIFGGYMIASTDR